MRGRRGILLGLLCAVAILAAFWPLAARTAPRPDEPAARMVPLRSGASALRLSAEAVRAAGLKTRVTRRIRRPAEVEAWGRLEADPDRTVTVQAPQGGTLGAFGRWPEVGQTVAGGRTVGQIAVLLPPADRIALAAGQLDRAARAEAAALDAARIRAAIAADQSDLQAARATARTDAAELRRLRILNASQKNASDRQVQQAELKVALDRGNALRAQRTLVAQEAALTATRRMQRALARIPVPSAFSAAVTIPQGGQVAAVNARPGQAVTAGQTLLKIERYDVMLARITLPPGRILAPAPATATIAPVGDPRAARPGRLVAAAAAEPASGAQTLLYRVSTTGMGLRPGSAVTARLPVGPARIGVVVPSSALVREANRTSVYVRVDPRTFVRQDVRLLQPVPGGWLVSGLPPGRAIVVHGAQVLLSAEMEARFAGGGGGGDD